MLNIGTIFKIQQKSKEHECYVGQEVIVLDYNCATEPNTYLVDDFNNSDFFCRMQEVPFEEVDESALGNAR
jgi:hypothetical protein